MTKAQKQTLIELKQAVIDDEESQAFSEGWRTPYQLCRQERVLSALVKKGLVEYELECGLGRAIPFYRAIVIA